MSENDFMPDAAAARAPRTAVFRLLAGVLVGAEALVVVGLTIWLGISLFTTPAFLLLSAIALFVLVLIGAIGVCAMTVGIFRGQRWARSGGVVVQILVLAVAFGAATDQFAHPELGLQIGIPAIVTLAVLIAEIRSVGRADAAAERAAASRAAAEESAAPDANTE